MPPTSDAEANGGAPSPTAAIAASEPSTEAHDTASTDESAPPLEVSQLRVMSLGAGLYTLHVGAAGGEPLQIGGLALPMTHIGMPAAGDVKPVEIVAAYPGHGSWLGPTGGTVVLSAPPGGGVILVTGYVAAGQVAAAPDIELRRLDRPDMVAGPGVEPAAGRGDGTPAALREIPTEIMLHIERVGDRLFPGRGWVGALGRKLRVEAFGLRPLERLAPGDIEFKAFEPNGEETPWVAGGTLCGTRGRGMPLIGFAVRVAPHLRDRFDAIYEGSFFDSGIVGPHRNGEPCRAAIADDPLEAMNIRLVERISTAAGD